MSECGRVCGRVRLSGKKKKKKKDKQRERREEEKGEQARTRIKGTETEAEAEAEAEVDVEVEAEAEFWQMTEAKSVLDAGKTDGKWSVMGFVNRPQTLK